MIWTSLGRQPSTRTWPDPQTLGFFGFSIVFFVLFGFFWFSLVLEAFGAKSMEFVMPGAPLGTFGLRQPASQAARQPGSQPAGQPASQPASKPQAARQPGSQTARQQCLKHTFAGFPTRFTRICFNLYGNHKVFCIYAIGHWAAFQPLTDGHPTHTKRSRTRVKCYKNR